MSELTESWLEAMFSLLLAALHPRHLLPGWLNQQRRAVALTRRRHR